MGLYMMSQRVWDQSQCNGVFGSTVLTIRNDGALVASVNPDKVLVRAGDAQEERDGVKPLPCIIGDN